MGLSVSVKISFHWLKLRLNRDGPKKVCPPCCILIMFLKRTVPDYRGFLKNLRTSTWTCTRKRDIMSAQARIDWNMPKIHTQHFSNCHLDSSYLFLQFCPLCNPVWPAQCKVVLSSVHLTPPRLHLTLRHSQMLPNSDEQLQPKVTLCHGQTEAHRL